MTIALLKMALEALSRPRPQQNFYQRACDDADVAKVIRAYLYEQPMQVAKRITAMQAIEALDELEYSARGDEPFNHAAAPVVREFIESTMLSAAPQAQPMHEGEIQAAWLGQDLDEPIPYTFVLGIRSAEQFNGIKEKP